MLFLAIAIIAFALLIGIVHIVTKGIKSITLKNIVEKIKSKIFFNVFLRYMVTAYLKLFLNGVIMLKSVNEQSPFKSLISVLFVALLAFIPTAFLSLL